MFNKTAKPSFSGKETYRELVGDFILDKLEEWARLGRSPGGFLTYCLENRLVEAVGAADGENRDKIPAIALYIYNQLPSESWGSPEAVQNWRGLESAR